MQNRAENTRLTPQENCGGGGGGGGPGGGGILEGKNGQSNVPHR